MSRPLLLLLFVFFVDAHGQIGLFVDVAYDRCVLITPEGTPYVSHQGLGQTWLGATDGIAAAWVPDMVAPRIHHIDVVSGQLSTIALSGQPRGVTCGPDGDAYVIVDDSSQIPDRIDHILADGSVQFFATIPDLGELIAADRFGTLFSVHRQGASAGFLTRVSKEGVFLGTSPLGAHPKDIRIGADDDVWVLCASEDELWHYSAGGVLLGQLNVPAGSQQLAVGPNGLLALCAPHESRIDILATTGLHLHSINVGGFPRAPRFDGKGAIWFQDATSSQLRRLSPFPWDTLEDVAPLLGSGLGGVQQGIDWARGHGAEADPDSDGVPSRFEMRRYYHPFDIFDRPFDFEVTLFDPTHGIAELCFRTPFAEGTLCHVGVSGAATAFGAGFAGSSLYADDLLLTFLNLPWAANPYRIGFCNAQSEVSFPIAVPLGIDLEGLVIYAGLLGFPQYGVDVNPIPSPAYSVVLP